MANLSAAKQRHRYNRVAYVDQDEDEGEVHDGGDEVPVKAIALAIILLLSGIILLATSTMQWLGLIHIQPGAEAGLFTLGILTFVPGAYATSIAYGAWCGCPGYSYSSLAK